MRRSATLSDALARGVAEEVAPIRRARSFD